MGSDRFAKLHHRLVSLRGSTTSGKQTNGTKLSSEQRRQSSPLFIRINLFSRHAGNSSSSLRFHLTYRTLLPPLRQNRKRRIPRMQNADVVRVVARETTLENTVAGKWHDNIQGGILRR
jgi:hypothetical protein